MAGLKIEMSVPLGPLSVQVFAAGGRSVSDRLDLSSESPGTYVENVAPGEYTIVATRPSGEQLVTTARVDANYGRAVIQPAGPSPREYLSQATDFGLAYSTRGESSSSLREVAAAEP